MLQREHYAMFSTFIKLPFVSKIFIWSIFEWLFYAGFTVMDVSAFCFVLAKFGIPHHLEWPTWNQKASCTCTSKFLKQKHIFAVYQRRLYARLTFFYSVTLRFPLKDYIRQIYANIIKTFELLCCMSLVYFTSCPFFSIKGKSKYKDIYMYSIFINILQE